MAMDASEKQQKTLLFHGVSLPQTLLHFFADNSFWSISIQNSIKKETGSFPVSF